jgi:hypothetical protein
LFVVGGKQCVCRRVVSSLGVTILLLYVGSPRQGWAKVSSKRNTQRRGGCSLCPPDSGEMEDSEESHTPRTVFGGVCALYALLV